jgi:hypothetical protein
VQALLLLLEGGPLLVAPCSKAPGTTGQIKETLPGLWRQLCADGFHAWAVLLLLMFPCDLLQ